MPKGFEDQAPALSVTLPTKLYGPAVAGVPCDPAVRNETQARRQQARGQRRLNLTK